jgi:replicative DNA helicase
VTPVTLKPYFEADPALIELGGIGYLVKITDLLAPGAILGHVPQLKEMAARRALVDALQDAADFACDMNNTRESIISAVDAAIVPEEGADSGIVQISAHDAFWEMVKEGDNRDPGVTAPNMPSFNEAMGPARPHHLCILAGRPGMGKTCAAMSYALSAAQDGNGVLFVSLEMSRTELMQRAAADLIFDGEFGVPYSAIRDSNLTDNARRRMHDCGHALRDLPFNIIDAGSLTIGRLAMLVRRYKRRMEAKGTPLRLVVVDYLQLVRPDHRTSGPVEAVSEVSRGLKAIAKTHDVAVMALAQLNRSVEQRDDKRPKLSDLRDSGQIEQDADAVVFLYRDHYYLKMAGPGTSGEAVWLETLDACQHDIDFICAKRRNGEARAVKGQFFGAYQAVRG